MVVTWNVELVLCGLVYLSISSMPYDIFLSGMILMGGLVCGLMHVICIAYAVWDVHLEISVALLSFNVGLGLAACLVTFPDPYRQSIVYASTCSLIMITLGMVFASLRPKMSTMLVFHHSVLSGVAWPMILVIFGRYSCSPWFGVMAFAVSVASCVLYALRLVRIALWSNTISCGLIVAWLAWSGQPYIVAALAVVLLGLLVWTTLSLLDYTLVDAAGTSPDKDLPNSSSSGKRGDENTHSAPMQETLSAAVLSSDVFQFTDERATSLRVRPHGKFS